MGASAAGSGPDERQLRPRDYPVRQLHTTRWADNDMYGHLNNAVYYQVFDAAINSCIIARTGAAPTDSTTLGVVAESGCRYFRELQFPGAILVGIGVERLGRTSVTYDLGLFPAEEGDDAPIAARGRWVHVYVDRSSRRPVPIPDPIRELLHDAIGESAVGT